MIRSEAQYSGTLKRIKELKESIRMEDNSMIEHGYLASEIERAVGPMRILLAQIEEEVSQYKSFRRGMLPELTHVASLGWAIVACRISQGMSLIDLAVRLNIDPMELDKLEDNNYYRADPELLQKILAALDLRVTITFNGVSPGAR